MPDFKPMLAKDAPDDLSKLNWPLIGQPKLDGIRCAIVNGKPLTRTLKDIPNSEIRATLSDLRLEGLDGEIIVGDPNAPDAYRTTVSFVMAPNKTGQPWCFYVFDRWNSNATFVDRYESLSASYPDYIKQVPITRLAGPSDLDQYEGEVVDAGGEGVILRDPNSAYKFGRSGKKGPLLKLKRFEDFEAVITGVYEEMHNANERTVNELGRGQRSSHAAGKIGKGTLGGFICKGLTDYEGVEFRVGTGFDAAMRVALWDAPVYGKTIKVKAFPVGAKDKPRHPVFLGFRDLEAGA